MSAPKVRCPACSAVISTGRGSDGRYWCTACDEVFEVHELPEDESPPRARARPEVRSRAPRRAPERPSNRLVVVLALAFGVIGLVGMGVAGYFALRKEEPPKEAVAADPPKKGEPPRVVPPPAPAKEPPEKAAPSKKDEPNPPTHEEIVRRVKGATVYVRTTVPPGQVGTGTGFFAGEPGFVVTNAHVVGYGPREVRPPSKVEVVLASGEAAERTLAAKVYGVDAQADLALLRVEGDDLPRPLSFGRASELVETQEVVIYGYPFGELLGKNVSVNRSSVSSLRREGDRLALVQLAGGLNPGNSGGPVTNARGEVVGVSVAKLRGAETIAFAIPAEEAEAFVRDQHRSGGRFETAGLVAVGPGPARPPVRPPVPPVRPPADPPPGEPTVPGTEVKLAAEVAEVCVGGGGRFLIVTLPKVKQVAIFDANQSKVVKHLPMAAERALIAAGADQLVVGYPDNNVIQRWSLTTFEKEASAGSPVEGTLAALCMGSDSRGPLYVGTASRDRFRAGAAHFLDPATLKVLDVKITEGQMPVDGTYVRASADGTVFGMRNGAGGEPHTVTTIVFGGERSASVTRSWGLNGSVLAPSPNGRFVYTNGAVYGSKLALIHPDPPPKQFPRSYLPSAQGYYYMRLDYKTWDRLGGAVSFFLEGSERPFAQLAGVEGVSNEQIAYGNNRDALTPDRRVFFLPDAKSVVTIPGSNDRLILRHFDVEKELERSGIDYFLVTSRPVPQAVRGAEYRYEMAVRSKKGGVKYKLDAGPSGMRVAADGKLIWAVPAAFAEPTADVIVTVSDASGQEVFHTFRLAVKDGAPR